jgi:hypothetical protein
MWYSKGGCKTTQEVAETMSHLMYEDLRTKPTIDVISELSVLIYQKPLVHLREHINSVPEVFRVLMLIIDFDTEITMNGILCFLENYTGRYLNETIDAFLLIGATETANTLSVIRSIMKKYDITWEKLRGDFADSQEYEITSFRKLHEENAQRMAKEVLVIDNSLYIYHQNAEPVFDLLEKYIDRNRERLLQFIKQLEK